ncbi:MAG: hypothetical protein ACTS73_04185 [Arsenophonus sp. NEOnobi-MAG3]
MVTSVAKIIHTSIRYFYQEPFPIEANDHSHISHRLPLMLSPDKKTGVVVFLRKRFLPPSRRSAGSRCTRILELPL